MREFKKNSWKVLWYTDIKFFYNLCNLKNSLNKENSSVILVLSILDILGLMRRRIKLSKQCVDQNTLYINYRKSIKVILRLFYFFYSTMTSLQRQLERLRLPQAKVIQSYDQKKKVSLLFDKGEAANIEKKAFYEIGKLTSFYWYFKQQHKLDEKFILFPCDFYIFHKKMKTVFIFIF